jgi:hypothetical protein
MKRPAREGLCSARIERDSAMGVFTAQPTSTLLASLLLAAGFALLGTVLLAFVFAYRTTYGVFAQRVLIGASCNGPAGATSDWQRLESSIRPFPYAQSDVRRRQIAAARAAAPTRAPPALDVSPGAIAHGASDAPVPGSRSPEPRPGPDPS